MVGCGPGRDARAGDPRQCAPAPPPARARHLAHGAPRVRPARVRRAARRLLVHGARARAVGRAQPRLGGLLRGHDRLASALEGEQPRTRTTCSRAEAGSTMSRRCLARRRARRMPARSTARRAGSSRWTSARRCASSASEVVEFWREHPGEKARLAGRLHACSGSRMCSRQRAARRGTWRDTARSVVEPAFMIALYVFALLGLFVLPRSFVVLDCHPARLPNTRRDGVRRRDAVSRALGLPHRDPRGGRNRRDCDIVAARRGYAGASARS